MCYLPTRPEPALVSNLYAWYRLFRAARFTPHEALAIAKRLERIASVHEEIATFGVEGFGMLLKHAAF